MTEEQKQEVIEKIKKTWESIKSAIAKAVEKIKLAFYTFLGNMNSIARKHLTIMQHTKSKRIRKKQLKIVCSILKT